jgi:hypothetical protein
VFLCVSVRRPAAAEWETRIGKRAWMLSASSRRQMAVTCSSDTQSGYTMHCMTRTDSHIASLIPPSTHRLFVDDCYFLTLFFFFFVAVVIVVIAAVTRMRPEIFYYHFSDTVQFPMIFFSLRSSGVCGRKELIIFVIH